MMVSRMLSDVARELGNLDLVLELLFETSKEHLPLRGLETIHDMRNGTDVISDGKENEFPINEFTVLHTILLSLAVIQERV